MRGAAGLEDGQEATDVGHSVLKHVRVRDYLRSLVTHELTVGDLIPSERMLCDRFGVSRMTVRQAVDALVVEGLLDREQGRGTFVAPSKVDLEVRLSSFGEEMRRRGLTPSSTVLAAEVTSATPDVADALELVPGERVLYLHRIRHADGEPMAIEQTWVPWSLAPDLFDGGPPGSVYGELRARGVEPDWGEDTVAASEVDAHDAELLGLRTGAAVLRLTRRTFAGDRACAYSRSSYRADRYVLWVPLRVPRRPLTPRRSAHDRSDTDPAEPAGAELTTPDRSR
ncbi:GntR family transcriptional regulator [Actinotalea sp. K2]|uniref:GntR family transcriptional regulator n=1 Tax=Actinotalea sp. K2 TaxID=2939438 RepID=UPI0020180872|nr:GntR family transcriptional regulator [Actinotalea sp. K2]MCL3860338.1 GntR family transcriptional regulator [Actinotalea sp. K2]